MEHDINVSADKVVTNTRPVESAENQMAATAGMALGIKEKPAEPEKTSEIVAPSISDSDIIDSWFMEFFKVHGGQPIPRDGRHIIGERGEFIKAERDRVSDAVSVLKQRLKM